MPPHRFPPATNARFLAVDAWITSSLIPPNAALESTLRTNDASDLLPISVAPNQGKLLNLLAKLTHATRILEIGTLGGYSAIWMAQALPPTGKLITCEISPAYAVIAQQNIRNAGLEDVIEVRVGEALRTLEELRGEKEGTAGFDLVFIDADKVNNVAYFQAALELSREGAVIVVDNVVRQGKVLDLPGEGEGDGKSEEGVRALFEYLKGEKRVQCTALQTVGEKGWDGFLLAMVGR